MTTINKGEEKIVINKEAFRNMLTHVLRFSNVTLNKLTPVMGLCLGKIDQYSNVLTIHNSIPVKHGSNVNENFSTDDLDAFNKIEKKFSGENLSFIGWYRSNSNHQLSETDEVNQLYFQKSKNSKAFCIIFDHSLIAKDDNFGIKIFRIKDYDKPNDYQTIPYEIQIPNTLEFFKWCQKFVEDFQKKSPIIIKEVSEIVESTPGELQEIPSVEEKFIEDTKERKFQELNPIISGYNDGVSEFHEIFKDIFRGQLGNWTNDFNQGILNGAQNLEVSISQMKEIISTGFSKIQSWFDRSANEIIGNFNTSVSNYISERVKTHKDIAIGISNNKIEIVDLLRRNIEEQLNSIFRNIEKDVEKLSVQANILYERTSEIEEKINSSFERVSSIMNNLANISEEITKQIKTAHELYEIKLSDEIQELSLEANQIRENHTNLDVIIQKLQKVTKEFKKI
jgi:uncharacterized protein YoxC